MAKDTMETLKLVEEKAKQALINAKEENVRIINSANEQKAEMFLSFENEKQEIEKTVNIQAKKEADALYDSITKDTINESEKLKVLYDTNKDKAIEAIAEIIVS
ncbi:MAG: hypothetical protein R3Y33_08635 [Clostridia bacterium]